MAGRRALLAPRAGAAAVAVAIGAATACSAGATDVAVVSAPPAKTRAASPAATFSSPDPQLWAAATLDKRARCTVSAKLVPSCGAWWGVAPAAFTSTPPTTALHDFEHKIGRTVDIFHAFHRGEQLFPTKEEMAIAREPGKRRILLLNWKPDWRHNWAEVAGGAMDGHIDRLAAHVNAHFPEKFFLVIHHEPEEEVRPIAGSGYTAADFRMMFRHVVSRLRAKGVHNALFTAVFMGSPKWGVKPWFDQLYPGNDVVDWLGMDPYASPDVRDFAHLVNKTSAAGRGFPGFYNWSAKIARGKPLMIAEWGAFANGAQRAPGARRTAGAQKAAFFNTVAAQLKRHPRIKALVYFETPSGPFAGATIDTRIDTSRTALDAFRALSGHSLLTH